MRNKYIAVFVGGILLAGFVALGNVAKPAHAESEGEGGQISNLSALPTAVRQNIGGEQESAQENSGEGQSALGGETEGESGSLGGAAKLSIEGLGVTQASGAHVTSVSGNALTVSVFGVSLNLSVSSTTQMVGVTALSDVAVGDTVTIKGTIDQATGVVAASLVQDETQKQSMITSIQQQIQALLAQLQQLQLEVSGQAPLPATSTAPAQGQ